VVPTTGPTVVPTAGPPQLLTDREFPLSPCGISRLDVFRHLYHNLFVGLPVFVLSSRCGSHYGSCCGSHCGTRCASRCLPSGCRVSLTVVRDSGGRAVLTSLPPVTVTVQSSCSRRARIVSSWLVVGFSGLRGVSCLHSTHPHGPRMRRRDIPTSQPHRQGRATERQPSEGSTDYRQEARLSRMRRGRRSPFGLWATSPAGLPGQGLEIPAGVCSDRQPR
jgi:hypothetical protein